MKIEVVNFSPLQDFCTVKEKVLARKGQFSPEDLSLIPYEQLFLCCTGEAGEARCSREDVVSELQRRRSQFLNMETDEREKVEIFLKVNQMDADVYFAQTYRNAPKWDSLSLRQKLWAKLNCIFNHIDDPTARIKDAILLLRRCTEDNSLPEEVTASYTSKLKDILENYPLRITDPELRNRINEMTEKLFDFLPPEEGLVVQREEIQGYCCTSDCYRVLP